MTMHRHTRSARRIRSALAGLALVLGCGDKDGGIVTDTDPVLSGFIEESSEGEEEGDPTEGSNETEGDPWTGETLGEGDLRGILTFAFYPPDALTGEAVAGLAGAWRTKDTVLTSVEDFFGVWGLQTAYPVPPAEPDTLEHNGLLAGFEWGEAKDWLLAGNAMKLVSGDTTAQACLLFLGQDPDYPIYAATPSEAQSDACRPDPGSFLPDAEYGIVLYGGDLFETNVLDAQVHTPPAFEVTAPVFAEFGAAIDPANDLVIRWEGEGNEGNRITIRASDMFGRMFTIHATDDGEYTIAATDLAELDAGPLTLTVARENLETVPFTDGTVQVLTRYEHWGYFELANP